MLWHCQETQRLLADFNRWLKSKNINLTLVEVIFNIGNAYSITDLEIFINLKYYIYAAKQLNQSLSLVAFQNKLKYYYILKQHTATKNGCLDKFANIWSNYKELIDSIH